MTTPLRVFVVDDAAVVRRMLTDTLALDPEVVVAGTAANGRIALAKLAVSPVDAVILDLEMDGMDGLETLAAIRKQWPELPVIMFSAFTERAAAVTLDALLMGANDYVTKPSLLRGVSADTTAVVGELLLKLKAACAKRRSGSRPSTPAMDTRQPKPVAVATRSSRQRFEVVVLGLSTGGPNALATLLPKLDPDFSTPILIVQHLSEHFTPLLAQRLNSLGPLRVKEAKRGDELVPGLIQLAPGDQHLAIMVEAGVPRVQLHRGAPENYCRPSVDILFRSAARHYGSHTLGVIMTGLGQDGLRGCEAIRSAGGHVIAQDEKTSVVWGMPGSVAKAGLADQVLPLDSIANEINRRVAASRKQHASSAR